MNKLVRKLFQYTGYLLLAGIVLLCAFAYFPSPSIVKHPGISTEQAQVLRQQFRETHHQFITSDGETLFLRRWDPDRIETGKKDIAVLIFHGITAHSGAYAMAGKPFSAGGYTTFGLDYRGHGLSGGNRGDCPGRERWVSDLSEAVHFIQDLGFSRVIIMGHSFGVAAAIYTARAIPDDISGLILLSGAYKGRPGVGSQPSFFQKVRILASSIIRPSFQVVEYYRDGMTGTDDPLFNFKYTLRFIRMLDRKELVFPPQLNVPVLVGVGDRDELFDVESVRELYNDVPGTNKEFLILDNTYHAKFPEESWEKLVLWMDDKY